MQLAWRIERRDSSKQADDENEELALCRAFTNENSPLSSRRGVARCEDCLGDFLVNFKCDHLLPCVCSSHSVVLSRMHSSYVLVSETCASADGFTPLQGGSQL